jgi:MoxR-like ATPase
MEKSKTLNTASSPVEEALQKIQKLREGVLSMVVGREEEVDGILTAMLAREHVVMVGPPGTAKSYITFLVMSSIEGAKQYKYQVHKHTTYDDLFGPIDVAELARNGRLVRRWSRLIEAHFVFFDEIFNASSAILNALLSLMQERIVYDPLTGEAIEVPLWSVIAATNRVPEEEELAAIYDRFAIKLHVQPIGTNMDKISMALARKWLSNGAGIDAKLSLEDIKVLHSQTMSLVRREDVLKLYRVYVLSLIQAAGVSASDRTLLEKLPEVFAAQLVLRGGNVDESTAAEVAHRIVMYVAKTFEEKQAIQKAINEVLGEVGELRMKLMQAKLLLQNKEFNKALELLKEVALVDLSKFESKPWLFRMASSVVREAQDLVIKVQNTLAKIKIE